MNRRLFLTLVAALCIAACSEEPTDDISTASAEQKIVNGVEESGFPAVGTLVYYIAPTEDAGIEEEEDGGVATGYRGNFCSGTLIRPNWVLTAAHCYLGEGFDVANYAFMMGEHAEQTEDASIPEGSKIYPAEQFIQHPKYDSYAGLYDIALMKLKTPVTDVTPMPLFEGDLHDYLGSDVKAIGYGRTAFGSEENNSRKRSTDLEIIHVFDANYIVDGVDTGVCHGDSGGPNVIKVGDEWQVCGVNKNLILDDYGDARDNLCLYPDGMTRVDAFRDWLLTNMGEEADCRQDPSLCHCPEACGEDGTCEPYRCGEHSTCFDAFFGGRSTLEAAVALESAIFMQSPEDIKLYSATMECAYTYSEHTPNWMLYCLEDYLPCSSEIIELGEGEATCSEMMECFRACDDINMACINRCNASAKGDAGRRALNVVSCISSVGCLSLDLDDRCVVRNCGDFVEACQADEGDDDDDDDAGLDADLPDGGMSDAEIDAEIDASEMDATSDAGDEDGSSETDANADAGDEDASEIDANADAGEEDASETDATADASDDAGGSDASGDASGGQTDAAASTDSGSDDAAKPLDKDADTADDDDSGSDDGCSAIPGAHSSSWLAFLGLPLLFGRRRRKA